MLSNLLRKAADQIEIGESYMKVTGRHWFKALIAILLAWAGIAFVTGAFLSMIVSTPVVAGAVVASPVVIMAVGFAYLRAYIFGRK